MLTFELITDLHKKLWLYQNLSVAHTSDEVERDPTILAALLERSALYPAALTVDVVRDLLAGSLSWPKSDGTLYTHNPASLQYDLIAMNLIRFIGGRIWVKSPRSVPENCTAEIRSAGEALEFIQSVKWGREDFVRPQLEVQASVVNELEALTGLNIALAGGPVEPDSLTSRNTYPIQGIHQELAATGRELWNLLVAKKNPHEAFARWLELMSSAFDYTDIFAIDFEGLTQKDLFLDCAVSFLLEDEDFSTSYEEEAHKRFVEESRFDLIFSEQQGKMAYEHFTSSLRSPPELGKVAAFEWWTQQSRLGAFESGRSLYLGLVYSILSQEHFAYNRETRFPRIQRIWFAAEAKPGLLGLIYSLSHNPSLMCLLLSLEETTAVGLLLLQNFNPAPQRRLGSKHDYYSEWKSLLWRQAVDAFLLHFSVLAGRSLEDSISDLPSVLLTLSSSAETNAVGLAASQLGHLLQEIERHTYLRYQNDVKRRLISDALPFLAASFANRDIQKPNVPGQIPLGDWALMFWCLSLVKRGLCKADDALQIRGTVCASITREYQAYLDGYSSTNGIYIEQGEQLSGLDWYCYLEALSNAERSRFVRAIDYIPKITDEVESPSEQRRARTNVVRTHIYILCRLLESSRTPDECGIADAISDYIASYGFAGPGEVQLGALDAISDRAPSQRGRSLWHTVCELSNSFSEEAFQKLLDSVFASQEPIRPALVLLNSVGSLEKRRVLEKRLAQANIPDSQFTLITELTDAVLLSINNHQGAIAESLIEFGKANVRRHHQADWLLLEHKFKLIRILEREGVTATEKRALIESTPIPAEEHTSAPQRSISGQLERFRHYIIALTFFDEDPDHCYRALRALCTRSADRAFAANMLSARVKVVDLLKSGDKATLFAVALEEWRQLSGRPSNDALTNFEASLVLYCLLEADAFEEFETVWHQLPKIAQIAIEVIDLRLNFLFKTSRSEEIAAYIALVRKLHSQLPPHVIERIAEAERGIRTNVKGHSSLLSPFGTLVPANLSTIAARAYWSEMQRRQVDWQAEVFSRSGETPDLIESFVLEQLVPVLEELVLRSQNLLRYAVEAAKTTVDIEIEDIITDWFCSLLRQRVGYLNWTVYDQRRMGRSQSQQGVGEADIWLEDACKYGVSIVEALRLSSCDTTSIDKHLDKVSGYDLIGNSPTIILIYSSSPNFGALCGSYTSYVSTRDYAGFEAESLPTNIALLDYYKRSNIRIYQEERLREGERIVFYHILVNIIGAFPAPAVEVE